MAIGTTLKIGFDSTKVKTGLSGIKSSFQSIAKVGLGIAKVGAAIIAAGVAAGVALTSIVIKLNGIGEAARTSEDRIRNIVKQMGLFGDEADTVSDRLIELSKTTARQIGVDEKVIQSTQAKLATFAELAESADEIGGAFDRATLAAVDMAAAGFGSAEENAVQLGKALNDPIKGITALSRSGVTFTEQEKEKIRVLVESGKQLKAQDMILKAIEKQVGGTAEATANSSDRIKVSFGQIVDAFAIPFSQGFDGLPGALESVFPRIIAAADEIGRIVSTSISQAIAGDTERLIKIGTLIGDILAESAVAAFQIGTLRINSGIMKLLEDINPVRRAAEGLGIDARRGSDFGKEENVGDLVSARLINAGVPDRIREIRESQPNPPPRSSDSPILERIEKNTRTGSKM